MNICKSCIHGYCIYGKYICGNFKSKYHGLNNVPDEKKEDCECYQKRKGFIKRFDLNG